MEGRCFRPPPSGSSEEEEEVWRQSLVPLIHRYESWMASDGSPYVHSGDAGLLLCRLLLTKMTGNQQLPSARNLPLDVSSRRLTFVEGASGVFSLIAVCDSERRRSALVNLLHIGQDALRARDNELWYGRVGVMFSLMFCIRELGREADEMFHSSIVALFDAVMADYYNQNGRWQWHNKTYFGLVHGYCGILGVLLRAFHSVFTQAEQVEHRKCLEDILKEARLLAQLLDQHGNLPSSLKKSKRAESALVQICHGAPGAIFLFRDLIIHYGCEEFRAPLISCAECVFQYGLLRKGVGLCHGIGGNGLALLSAFEVTNDPVWLSRATSFAIFAVAEIGDDRGAQLVMTPDDPFGLVNGIGGLVMLLAHLHFSPKKVSLPFY